MATRQVEFRLDINLLKRLDSYTKKMIEARNTPTSVISLALPVPCGCFTAYLLAGALRFRNVGCW